MKKWMTITEIAKETGIPDSTCRRYLTQFSDFFVLKGGSRQKKYEDKAVPVLLRIQQLFSEGLIKEEIEKTLSTEFPLVVEIDEEKERVSSPQVPTLPTAEYIEQMVGQIVEKRVKEENTRVMKYLDERLNKHDELLLQTIRAIQESKKELAATQQKKWWQFWKK